MTFNATPAQALDIVVEAALQRVQSDPTSKEQFNRGEAIIHLVRCQNAALHPVRPTRFPSSRWFAEKWNWTRYRVQKLLHDESAWNRLHGQQASAWETLRREAPKTLPAGGSAKPRPNLGQTPATGQPGISHNQTDETATTAKVQPQVSQESAKPRPNTSQESARARISRTPTPTPTPEDMSPDESDDVSSRLADAKAEGHQLRRDTQRAWNRFRELNVQGGYASRRAATPPRGWGVRERVKEHGLDRVLLVVDWAHLAPSHGRKPNGEVVQSRAGFLREQGFLEEQTIFRPSNFQKYLAKAQEWDAAGRPTLAVASGRGDELDRALDELLGTDRWQRPDPYAPPNGADQHGGAGWDLHEDEAVHRRLVAALEAAGGWSRRTRIDNEFERNRMVKAMRQHLHDQRGAA